jgi:hypothetical protein
MRMSLTQLLCLSEQVNHKITLHPVLYDHGRLARPSIAFFTLHMCMRHTQSQDKNERGVLI